MPEVDLPLAVPPFYCPISAVKRADADEIDRASFSWLASLGACDAEELEYLNSSRCGLVSAWSMPYASVEGVRIAADIMYLTEGADDTSFETGLLGHSPDEAMAFLTQLARLVEAPDTPLLMENPWVEGLRDVCRRFAELATPLQTHRWISAWHRLFSGLAWETVCRARGNALALDHYVMMRVLGTIAVEIFTTLNDAADGYELTPCELNGLPVRALTETTWMITAFDNDLYSYHQEHLRHPNGINFIDLTAHTLSCSPAEAIPQVMGMRDRVMVLFLQLREQVRVGASENLCRYLDSLGYWLRANIDWGTTSERYQKPLGPNSPPETWALLPTEYATEPTDAALEPIGIPVVAWWWSQLRTEPEGH